MPEEARDPEEVRGAEVSGDGGPRPPSCRTPSLRRRLLLLIVGLPLVAIIAYSWPVYREVRGATLLAALERLQGATRQLADLLETSVTQRIEETAALARRSEIVAYLRSPGEATQTTAAAALDALARESDQIAAVELQGPDRATLLAVGGRGPAAAAGDVADATDMPAVGESRVGPLRLVDGMLLYPVVAAVGDRGARLGYVVQWRRVASSPQAATLLNELIGTDATILLGNASGDVWTDLVTAVPAPPLPANGAESGLLEYVRPEVGARLASTGHLEGAPWMVLVEFPRSRVLAGPSRVLQRMGVIAAVVLVLGAATGWLLSRNMTRPLAELASTAQAIAAGDYGRRAGVGRYDELRHLAAAFNIMAHNVQESVAELASSADALEEEVADRTTELRAALERLRASEEQFRSLALTAHDAIVTADAGGNITYFNPAAEETFGYAAQEVAGRPITTLMPERFHEAHRRGLGRYVTTGEARVIGRTVELTGRRKDGTEFPVELSLASWRRNGEPRFAGILRDITSRKQMDEALRRNAAELEAANEELEAFSYSVSHDLRAPLRSIDGFCLALLEDCEPLLDETGRDHLRRVRAASQRMALLIDDLLDLSRVSRAPLEREAVDLTSVAEGIAGKLLAAQPPSDAEFEIQPRVRAHGDRRLLTIVLENLLENARKFSSRRPGARIEFGMIDEEGEPVYFVRDNGAGFDMEYAEKLFGPFQRLHSGHEFEGTGIGLATVQRIVHRHGGRVWAEGRVDGGATFFFTLSPEPGGPTR